MAMEARAGDFIEIQACGEDAEQAVKTIAQIRSELAIRLFHGCCYMQKRFESIGEWFK